MFELNGEAVSYFLRWGFIPPPLSIFVGENKSPPLDVGHSFSELSSANCGESKIPFLFSQDASGGCRDYSFSEFEEALSHTVDDISDDKEMPIGIMLSGGKDSVALAFALHKAGYTKVYACTYCSGSREDEAESAKAVADALGFTHKTIIQESSTTFDIASEMMALADSPNGDFAYLAYLECVNYFVGVGVACVIDGMGNDLYVGHVPPKYETTLQFYSLPNIFGKVMWGISFFRFSKGYKFEWLRQTLFMHPIERMFSGVRFDITDLRNFGMSTSFMWRAMCNIWEKIKSYEAYDRRAIVRGGLFDVGSCAEKATVACRTRGLVAKFPYLDEVFVEYYLSLFVDSRFDWVKRKNKISFRRYILAKSQEFGLDLEYSDKKKGSFRFDYFTFVQINSIRMFELYSSVFFEDDRLESLRCWSVDKLRSSISKADCPRLYLCYCLLGWLIAKGKLDAVVN